MVLTLLKISGGSDAGSVVHCAWNMTLLDTVTDSDGKFDLRWIRWPSQELTVSIEVGDERRRVRLNPAEGSIATDLRFDGR